MDQRNNARLMDGAYSTVHAMTTIASQDAFSLLDSGFTGNTSELHDTSCLFVELYGCKQSRTVTD